MASKLVAVACCTITAISMCLQRASGEFLEARPKQMSAALQGAFYSAAFDQSCCQEGGDNWCCSYGGSSLFFAPAEAPIGICFGGATPYSPINEATCGPDGPIFTGDSSKAPNTQNFVQSTNKFYSFGGGGGDAPQDRTSITKAYLQEFSAIMGNLKTQGYDGIFYDIENIIDATSDDFAQSFTDAKNNNFQIIVGTSYSAPYASAPGSDEVWRSIMKDTNIDIISPQFYGDGKTANIVKTSNSNVQLSEYGAIVPSTTKVMPSLKAMTMDDFNNQVQMMSDACSSNAVPTTMCMSGYFLWASA